MANVLVTVGMGRWPFDRLVAAVAPLCAEHRVMAQIGTATVLPPCPHARFLPYPELLDRITAADVVVTHAGNTVRLVQRAGKVPIVVARLAARGEMSNDHQVAYLRQEEATGPVVAVWDVADLGAAVRDHPAAQARLLAERPLPSPTDPERVAAILDATCAGLVR
jgi:UDP-N-acetylglucosamine transferase subunit ALG13